MKKKRQWLANVLIVVMLLSTCLQSAAFAETGTQKLEAPTLLKDSEGKYPKGYCFYDGLYTYFEEVEEANGRYRIEVFKNNKKYNSGNISSSHPEGKTGLWQIIDQNGSYTFHLKALSDNPNVADSEWSEMSEPFVYQKPDLAFGEPRNLRWSDSEAGVAEWDPPAGLKNIPEEYRKKLRYYVLLYEDGQECYSIYNVSDTSWDFSNFIEENVDYTFGVRALSRDIEHVAHSKWVESGEYINIEEISGNVKTQLQDLYLNFSSPDDSDEEGALASPSNLLDAIEKELDLKETAIAMQADEEALGNLKDLEELYLEQSGQEVKRNISEDTGMSEDDIEVIGAGLNIASGSDAIEINVQKADKNRPIDEELYTKPAQFSITLSGGVGKLRAPITIIMPIPENIKPDFLCILHYHNNGDPEIIYPKIIDGNKAQFTVTEFSIFAFVERVNDLENGNEDPIPNPDDDNDSGNYSSGRFDDDDDSSSSSTTGSTSTDRKKGYVNSVKGIITGYGNGYSQWFAEPLEGQPEGSVRWKLQYADGSFAAGSYMTDADGNLITDADGNPIEQPAWELIDGAWFAFGADGYTKSGMTFDPVLNGWFYLDITTGMKTGWQLIDGNWYYFNPVSNGTKGIMYQNQQTPDGYYVDENGIWNDASEN